MAADSEPDTPQDRDAPAVESPTPQPAEALEGIWPTDRMVELLVRRLARQAGEEFDLRPDQRVKLEAQMLERWPQFLDDNRAQMQPLLNQFLEMRLGIEPPDAQQVADWAERATPVYEKLRKNIDESQLQFREVLTPRQQAQLDKERLKTSIAMESVSASLKRWRRGEFKDREFWEPTADYRATQAKRAASKARKAAQAARAAAEAQLDNADELPPRAAEELAFWPKWVKDFCDRYQLDTSQRNAADSILRELLGRAQDHVRRNIERIRAVERIIESDGSADEPAVLKELEEVYGPLEKMGTELQQRIERLPTTAQRRRVELAEKTTPTSSPSAPEPGDNP